MQGLFSQNLHWGSSSGGLDSNGVFHDVVLHWWRYIVRCILLLFGIEGTVGKGTSAFALLGREVVTYGRLIEGFIRIVAYYDFRNRVRGLFLQDFNTRGLLCYRARWRGRGFATIMVVVHDEAATTRCKTMLQNIMARRMEGDDFDGLEGDESMPFDYFGQTLKVF